MKSKRGCVISLWHALLFFFMFFALEAFLLRRLLMDLRGGDLFGRCRYPLRVEYVPQISQICTDFSWEVLVTQISQMTQIFFHRVFLFIGFHGINSEVSCYVDYSRIYAEATCSVVTDTPCEWNMSHRFHRFTQIFPASISFPSISFLYSHFSFLISHFSLHYPFLPFYFFTFKKSRCQKIEKNKQNIKRKLHYFFYFCREILNL